MKMLVGYTGFVGSNLCRQAHYDRLFNSKNIRDAFGQKPELLVYSGVPAEMFTANADPARDQAITENAFQNMVQIAPKRVVLISTVAVYDTKIGADEDHIPDPNRQTPYGKNRYALERQVEEHFPDSVILRLPAIYGHNLKKNFIYDYIQFIPALLKESKYLELSAQSERIFRSYTDRGDGFFRCGALSEEDRQLLKREFQRVGFSALNFTDSRSVYQFLDLKYLDQAMTACLEKGIRRLNLVPPPVNAAEVYRMLSGGEFVNECTLEPICYDLKTKYTASGYIMEKQQELADIRAFVEAARKSEGTV